MHFIVLFDNRSSPREMKPTPHTSSFHTFPHQSLVAVSNPGMAHLEVTSHLRRSTMARIVIQAVAIHLWVFRHPSDLLNNGAVSESGQVSRGMPFCSIVIPNAKYGPTI